MKNPIDEIINNTASNKVPSGITFESLLRFIFLGSLVVTIIILFTILNFKSGSPGAHTIWQLTWIMYITIALAIISGMSLAATVVTKRNKK